MSTACHVACKAALAEHLFQRLQAAAHNVPRTGDYLWLPWPQANLAGLFVSEFSGEKSMHIIRVVGHDYLVDAGLAGFSDANTIQMNQTGG
jgi:hypothetical protein